jgi:hypothetical protein
MVEEKNRKNKIPNMVRISISAIFWFIAGLIKCTYNAGYENNNFINP